MPRPPNSPFNKQAITRPRKKAGREVTVCERECGKTVEEVDAVQRQLKEDLYRRLAQRPR